MKEVKKCSLSGVAFTMDVDAFNELENYFERLKKAYKETPDGAEIVADIEARIAELILSAQNSDRVVEKPLIDKIISQMGSPEDITEEGAPFSSDEPRIPRRLYRDTENAKLGGVCAGIGKYFDIDPVWIRLGIFVPVLLTMLHWIPFMHWIGPMMGNLFGIFVICYLIMWFAVPAARTARQKLEMNGQKITAQSIRETTKASTEAASATPAADADVKAKPIIAEAVSVFGKVVLILLKIFAGIIVFSLIVAACTLIIALFALIVGGVAVLPIAIFPLNMTIWIPILLIFVVLLPIILLIYVLMCLIASRKPGGWAVLIVFLLWLASFIGCASIMIHERAFRQLREMRKTEWRMFDSQVKIDNNNSGFEIQTDDVQVKVGKDGVSIKTNQTQNEKQALPADSVKALPAHTDSATDSAAESNPSDTRQTD